MCSTPRRGCRVTSAESRERLDDGRDARSVERGRRLGHRRRRARRPQAARRCGRWRGWSRAARQRVRPVQRHRARRRRVGADPRCTGRARHARRPAAVGSGVEPDLERGKRSTRPPQSRRRIAIHSGDARIEHARELLVDARERARRWQLPDGFEAVGPVSSAAIDGDAGRCARRSSDRIDECVHEWRKSVKNLWYQTRLLEALPSAPGR